MSARIVLFLIAVALLAALLGMLRLPAWVAAQDPFPTPVGRLGGREPLPTAVGVPTGPPSSPTPEPADALAGAWLLAFADEDRAPARLVLAADGLAGFVDGDGNRGAGAWVASGPQRGVLAVAVTTADVAGRQPTITVLQGTITGGPGDDAATLKYTTAAVDGAGSPAEPAGPFRATGQRAGDA